MKYTCGRRTQKCRRCGHEYTREEYELLECPTCGEDRRCQASVGRDGEACKRHGGASLKGVDAPAYVHGRYSQYLPARLRERFEAGLADPELLDLSREISLVQRRVEDILAGMATGETAGWLEVLRGHYNEVMVAMSAGDEDGAAQALFDMGQVLKSAAAVERAWSEVLDTFESLRKLVESQRKREVEADQILTVQEAALFLGRVQYIILRHVTDVTTRQKIAAELEAVALFEPGDSPTRLPD